MKTYLVTWDVCFMIVNCETKIDFLGEEKDDLFEILKKEDSDFFKEDGIIKYDWGHSQEICGVEDVTGKEGVVFGGAFG